MEEFEQLVRQIYSGEITSSQAISRANQLAGQEGISLLIKLIAQNADPSIEMSKAIK